ncbi:hypothetical protein GC093_29625 [Paenibacillus sp. LMG 31456]|uniref:Hsp20/alpha crystallin family protein n=1 Tax=Paenibacillus foliorum TaxID=2654974 RepID=A0A972K248_9BACL|nr:Hsp20/alpha crystallin family protein [Paenibacillus foliorum]NOU97359.1 hypothetical protein [Paenibacillus foliorum]
MDNNNNPFSVFNWKKFEESFGGRLPQVSRNKNDGSTWVEQYVQDILKQSIQPLNQSAGGEYDTEIAETEHALIMKINIPDKTEAKTIKTYVSINQVKLEGNAHDKFQLIRLPHPVIPTSCKAIYKDGSLQLHIRKQSKDEQFYEIDVKYS